MPEDDFPKEICEHGHDVPEWCPRCKPKPLKPETLANAIAVEFFQRSWRDWQELRDVIVRALQRFADTKVHEMREALIRTNAMLVSINKSTAPTFNKELDDLLEQNSRLLEEQQDAQTQS